MKIKGYVILTHDGTKITATSDVIATMIDVYANREEAELMARTAYKARKAVVKRAVITVIEEE